MSGGGGAQKARLWPAARRRLGGFTLLEIMVVVLIIGIVTAGMLLSMSFAGKDTELETESKRLLSLMDYARDQAELQTREYGVLFSQHGYEFVVYDVRRGAWRQVDEDDALRERMLPSGLGFRLVVDARSIVLRDSLDEANAQAAAAADSKSASQSRLRRGTHRSSNSNSDSGSDSSSDSNSDSGSDSSSDSDSSDSGATALAPQVMIFSSGDLSSFQITLERVAAGHSITLDENKDGDIVQKPMVGSGT